MSSYFTKWQTSLTSVQSLYESLEVWNQQKNINLLKVYIKTWRIQLIADQARKTFHERCLYTILWEWRTYTKGKPENVCERKLRSSLLIAYNTYIVHMFSVEVRVF